MGSAGRMQYQPPAIHPAPARVAARRSAFGCVLLVLSTAWLGADHRGRVAESTPSYAWVIFGPDTVRAEIARTAEERERGLMFRESVPDGTGMLFVFPQAEIQGIWMKDTYVPLDVAFLNAQFRILSIEQLEPLDLTPRWSQGPVLFALEVRQGWFADHHVSVGDRAEIVFGVR